MIKIEITKTTDDGRNPMSLAMEEIGIFARNRATDGYVMRGGVKSIWNGPAGTATVKAAFVPSSSLSRF